MSAVIPSSLQRAFSFSSFLTPSSSSSPSCLATNSNMHNLFPTFFLPYRLFYSIGILRYTPIHSRAVPGHGGIPQVWGATGWALHWTIIWMLPEEDGRRWLARVSIDCRTLTVPSMTETENVSARTSSYNPMHWHFHRISIWDDSETSSDKQTMCEQ